MGVNHQFSWQTQGLPPRRRDAVLCPVGIQTLHRMWSVAVLSFMVQDLLSIHLQPIISTTLFASAPFYSLHISAQTSPRRVALSCSCLLLCLSILSPSVATFTRLCNYSIVFQSVSTWCRDVVYHKTSGLNPGALISTAEICNQAPLMPKTVGHPQFPRMSEMPSEESRSTAMELFMVNRAEERNDMDPYEASRAATPRQDKELTGLLNIQVEIYSIGRYMLIIL